LSKVKDKTLRRIEDYFARETTLRGSAEIQVTLEDLKRETQLSLVTIYKALDALIESGQIKIVDQGTRRSPKIYHYFPTTKHDGILPSSDLTGLTKALEDLVHELTVKEQVIGALRTRLAAFEAQETQVLYRLRVSEDVEVIVRSR